jgi:hypothetical protein
MMSLIISRSLCPRHDSALNSVESSKPDRYPQPTASRINVCLAVRACREMCGFSTDGHPRALSRAAHHLEGPIYSSTCRSREHNQPTLGIWLPNTAVKSLLPPLARMDDQHATPTCPQVGVIQIITVLNLKRRHVRVRRRQVVISCLPCPFAKSWEAVVINHVHRLRPPA